HRRRRAERSAGTTTRTAPRAPRPLSAPSPPHSHHYYGVSADPSRQFQRTGPVVRPHAVLEVAAVVVHAVVVGIARTCGAVCPAAEQEGDHAGVAVGTQVLATTGPAQEPLHPVVAVVAPRVVHHRAQ